jgi:bifunctional DNase/RNase
MARVQLEVVTLAEGVSQSNSYTVLLQEKHGTKRFVIVIGYSEAQAIALSLDGNIKPNRPLTHDLFHQVCKNFNVELLEVAITDLKEGIYYANLVCKKGDHIIDIDSRSSDALALALRFDCPIYIDELLLNKVCIEDKRDEQQTIQEFEEELEEELKEIENMTIDELDKDQTNFTKKTLTELKSMLKKALQNEDYELAAKLRDEISKRK